MKSFLIKLPILVATVLFCALSFSAWSNDKLSANTKMFLMQRTDSSETHNNFTFAKPKVVNGVEYIDCFIYLDEMSFDKLESLGVKVTDKYSTFVTASVPINMIEDIANLSCVKQIDVSTMMKQYYTPNNSDNVVSNEIWRNNTRDVPSDYTGKDVVVGIVDVGIQFNHIAFLDANGKSRVKAVYMPNTPVANGGSTVEIDGLTMNGYQYTTASQIANLTTDDVHRWGGTYSAGCAAGSVVGDFSGIAPESDLVICATGSFPLDNDTTVNHDWHVVSGTDLVNSVKYIANYAKSVGKPCVVYMPYGTITGSHDGSSELAYDEIAEQYGITIIMPTWDLADVPRYATKTNSENNFKMSVSLEPISGTSLQGVCEFWCNNTAPQAEIIIFNKSTGHYLLWSLAEAYADLYGGLTISHEIASNGRHHYTFSFNKTIPEDRLLVIRFGNNGYFHAGDVVNVYSEGNIKLGTEFIFVNDGSHAEYYPTQEDFCPGQYDGAINNAVCGKKSISVGAFASDQMYNGPSCTGDVVSYSGYGTDYNGFNHPFITAPGLNIISSANGYCSGAINDFLFSSVINGQTFYWADHFGFKTCDAAAIATGVVALYLQAAPWLNVDEIKDVIQHSATKYINASSPPKQRGHGIINSLAGIQYIKSAHTYPYIFVGPTKLIFDRNMVNAYTKTIKVKGFNLNDDVNIVLNGDDVFSVTPTTISPEDAYKGVDINVSFKASSSGHYNGSIIFTSSGAESKTVQLEATAIENGSAFAPFLNIGKYATIDEAGATVSGMSSIYKYTEYPNDACAWLTISNYGARKVDDNQNWIDCEGDDKSFSGYWNAKGIFLGSSSYFTGTAYSAYWNEAYQNFYVTNCTQVRQYSYNIQSDNNNGNVFPLRMNIYECTLNADGTLSVGTTAVVNKQSQTTNQAEVLSSGDLDPSKIYKVRIYNDYSRLYEIGFKTPIQDVETPVATDATEVGTNEFTANWNACEGAQSYTLRVMPKSDRLLLAETFANCNYAEPIDISGNLDNYLDNPGWTGCNINTAIEGLCLGTANSIGTLTTPALNLSGDNKVSVKINAKTYDGNAICRVKISCGNDSKVIYLYRLPAEYTVVLDCTSADQYVTLETTIKNRRIILSKVDITVNSSEDTVISRINDQSFTVTGLRPATNYLYEVKANYGNYQTKWSNRIDVLTLGGLSGDVNGDNVINVTDYVKTAGYILDMDPQPFIFAAADIDANGTISVDDLVAVANLALNYEGVPQLSPSIGSSEIPNIALHSDIRELDNDCYEVCINLNNNICLTAFQMDLNLPQGMALIDASLSDRASSSHQIAYNQLKNGNYRLLASSAASKPLNGNKGTVLTLTLTGIQSGSGYLNNIKFATPSAGCYEHDAIELNFNTSCVNDINSEVGIYKDRDNIVIMSPNNGTAQIILPNGVNQSVKVAVGLNVFEAPTKGLVIVKMQNMVKKLIF